MPKYYGTSGSDRYRYTGEKKLKAYGYSGDDVFGGGYGNDSLLGGRGQDRLVGAVGNDYLVGGRGDDTLIGSLGNDYLVGGEGADKFSFYFPTDGIDTISDFNENPGEGDQIVVSAFIFSSGLVSGAVIDAAQFTIGTEAADTTDRFIYNQSIGALFFDADGTGLSEQIQIAQLNPGLALTNVDIFVDA
jgi:Ca2+-binding RTX toxin-like protein